MTYPWLGMLTHYMRAACHILDAYSDYQNSFHIGQNTLGSKFGDLPGFDKNIMSLFSSFLEEVYRTFSSIPFSYALGSFFFLFLAPSIRSQRALREVDEDSMASSMLLYA